MEEVEEDNQPETNTHRHSDTQTQNTQIHTYICTYTNTHTIHILCIQKRDHYVLMCICVSLREFVHVSAVHAEARRGSWIPWSWSDSGCKLPQELNLGLVQQQGVP